ncbi:MULTISPECIES: penicillin-binding transpeptidase domain-containing protein [Dehalobacter]|uniref:PASTA domain-containing protein n=1 Tax=Dehalobacter restrictus TaxID=55583 RepID=A0A857DJ23_9FIRM|nr:MULTISPECIES: penicillin-binding transpeptidase domain-containing protein [Dehalobacter]MDJ0304593.1 penicillin-binding transpeptidase domain-containing protein [Dehalobacter sp.]OCZ53254.1 cell division protein FtsI [Dehalobacter sp. TeCB1]QHA00492.1 PASTA domain-containing protein [Dehalobacter restrictus]
MKKTKQYFYREWVIYGLLIGLSVLILGRLFYLQVINSAELKARGADFQAIRQTMLYERGTIMDAQGNVLAKSVPVKDVYADPRMLDKSIAKDKTLTSEQILQKKEKIAENIAAILGEDKNDILTLLRKDLAWVSLKRQVDISTAEKIKELDIQGIGFSDNYKRSYPAGEMGAAILGIVNMAGDGVEGLEYSYNAELKGEANLENPVETDQNNEIQDNVQSGDNLTLTLDSTIQHLIEHELDDIVAETKPQRAVILAMDPKTGKILGMGSRPSYDPSNYASTKPDQRKNLAISMIYEPGSTFKIITGSAALEENAINTTQLFKDPGYWVVGGRRITNWDSDKKAHGNITFVDGMKLSSNVVLAQVGQKLGRDLFYTYLKSFGFGSLTDIDISGEERGLLIDKSRVKSLELATMSFGQANLVTPIQLLTAICAVANGGQLMQPYIVENIKNKDGEIVSKTQPKIVRQVISKTTSKTMSDILVSVVDSGTGSRAKIPGIKVAGKTGTAQKIDPETGKYSDTDYIVSFVGYAPANDPKIAVLVVIDTPHAPVIQGGTLGGPRVKNIIEGTLQYYGVPVSAETPSDLTKVDPDVLAEQAAAKNGNTEADKNSPPARQAGEGEVLVPDLKGLTIRQAGELLGKLDLRYEFGGSGLAYKQSPEAGKVVNRGDTIEVLFGTGE